MQRRAFQRSGKYGNCKWRQLHLVEDGAVTTLELKPALLDGWRVTELRKSAGDDWPGMSAEAIAHYIATNWADCELVEIVPTHFDEVMERYQKRLGAE